MRILIADSLTCGDGVRSLTRDFIGSGPRTVASFLYSILGSSAKIYIKRTEELIDLLGAVNSKIFNPISQSLDPLDPKSIDILMISAMTMDINSVKSFIEKWHSLSSSLIIVGGPISSDPSMIKSLGADIAFIGESERIIQKIFADFVSKDQSGQPTTLGQSTKSGSTEQLQFSKSSFIEQCRNLPNVVVLKSNKTAGKNIEFLREEDFLSGEEFASFYSDPRFILSYSDYRSAKVYVECVRGCSNYRRTSIPIGDHKCNPSCGICRGDQFSTTEKCPSDVPPGCGFCSTNYIHGPVRSKTVEVITKEIQELIKLGVKRIVLGGPDFLDFRRELMMPDGKRLISPVIEPTANYEELGRLIDNILAIKQIANRDAFVFIENIKASLCTDEALDILARLPDPIFSIGCETGSDKFADILGRPNSPSVTYDAVKRAIRRGIRIHVYFIHGLPGDTVEFAKETLNLLNDFAQLNVDKFTIYKYQEVPGSPFYYRNQSQRKQTPNKAMMKMESKIKNFVIKYNEDKKQDMVNKKYRVLIAEPNNYKPRDAIGIIMEGGPKVSIKNGIEFMDTLQTVLIIRVISDKLVEGRIVESADGVENYL